MLDASGYAECYYVDYYYYIQSIINLDRTQFNLKEKLTSVSIGKLALYNNYIQYLEWIRRLQVADKWSS